MGFGIFKHSLKMVFSDLGTVFRISIPVFLVILIGGIVLVGMIGINNLNTAGPGLIVLMAIIVVAYIFAVLWMAVAWHRYVLLEEYPNGVLPPLHQGRILAYFGRGILLTLIFGGVIFVGAFVLGGLASGGAPAVSALVMIIGIVGLLLVVWSAQRLSVILPAAAIGKPIGIGEAWEKTAPIAKSLILLLVIYFLFSFVLGFIQGILMAFAPILGLIYQVVFAWLNTVIGLSILTTTYGIAVEGRSID